MKNAFSLVELSIVLVIIGLLTGGIMAGQSLLKNAALSSVAADFNRYSTAINNFADKYGAYPGDMIDATAYWRKDNAACSTHTGTAGTPGTCNGNGDGLIADAAAANATGESFQMWRQLALASLIEGNYSGLSGSASGADYDFGVNAPTSKIDGAGWGNYGFDSSSGTSTYLFAYDYSLYLVLGSEDDNNRPDGPVLTPKEVWQIDSKIDDGAPATGFVHTIRPGACTTTSTTTNFSAEYLRHDNSAECAPIMKY